jgi:two-component system, NarL family, response regulator NreC
LYVIGVFLADDHAVLRAGLKLLIHSQPDMHVVGEAGTAEEALRGIRQTRPHVAILDLSLPDFPGLTVVERLRTDGVSTRILVLTMHDEVSYLRAASALGVNGYVAKRSADSELLTAIRTISRGGCYVDSSLSRELAEDLMSHGRRGEPAEAAAVLSPREKGTLELISLGYTNREIAEKFGVSTKTVETYRVRVGEKLGLKTRADLTRYALESGLLPKKIDA